MQGPFATIWAFAVTVAAMSKAQTATLAMML
jgi:hypothetical protein